MHGALGDLFDLNWRELLTDLADSDEFDAVCFRDATDSFSHIYLGAAFHVLRRFNTLLDDMLAYEREVSDVVKARLMDLYYHLFGLETNDDTKVVRFRVLPSSEDIIGIPIFKYIEVFLDLSPYNAGFAVDFTKACVHALQLPELEAEYIAL
ncbi:MAG: hypothetical protein MHM6MM_003082 [Cercozoa sp. M6MM]